MRLQVRYWSLMYKKILEYIKNLKSAFEIIQKLKSLHGNEKSDDIQNWMKKMYSLSTKNLMECKDVINQINEIFDIMERNKADLGVWEKIRILYLSFPRSLKDQIHPDGTETVENFLTEVKNKINFQIYLHSTVDYNKNIDIKEDLIELDFIDNQGQKRNLLSFKRKLSIKEK